MSRSIPGTIGPTIAAMVADLSPQGKLAESYAMLRVGSNVGFAIGPAIGGYLMGFLSFGWLFSISAFISLLVASLGYFFLRESYGGSSRGRGPEKYPCGGQRSTLPHLRHRQHPACTLDRSSGWNAVGFHRRPARFLHRSVRTAADCERPPGCHLSVPRNPPRHQAKQSERAYPRQPAVCCRLRLTRVVYHLQLCSDYDRTHYGGGGHAGADFFGGRGRSAPADKRGRYMGFFTLSQTLGQSMSPLFGGILLDAFPDNPRLLWGIIGSVGLVAAAGFRFWGKIAAKAPAPQAIATSDSIQLSASTASGHWSNNTVITTFLHISSTSLIHT